MNERELSIFLKDLSNMLSSGLGLDHSLRTLSETAMESSSRGICSLALSRLEDGASLSDALSASGSMPKVAIVAIGAGELAGELPIVFNMLADFFALRSEIRNKVLSSLGYPLLVFAILFFVLVYMSVDVLPKIAILLPRGAMGSSLTGTLVLSGNYLKAWGVMTGICILGSIIGFVAWAKLRSVDYRKFVSTLPVIGNLFKDQELALAFFALYIFQKSGVPLDKALDESADVAGGATGEHIRECLYYLVGGMTLSEAVRRDTFFPRFTADTLRIGEESGRFEEYFERLYVLYYGMYRSRMDRLAGSVRPIMLGMAGLLIALIAIGFLQPLYGNLSNLAMP